MRDAVLRMYEMSHSTATREFCHTTTSAAARKRAGGPTRSARCRPGFPAASLLRCTVAELPAQADEPERVLGRALVVDDGVVLEREGAVREAGRHPDDAVVPLAQLDRHVVAERRRARAHVDHHVEDRAADAAHVFPHRGIPLEVEAAHD